MMSGFIVRSPLKTWVFYSYRGEQNRDRNQGGEDRRRQKNNDYRYWKPTDARKLLAMRPAAESAQCIVYGERNLCIDHLALTVEDENTAYASFHELHALANETRRRLCHDMKDIHAQ